MDYEIIATLGPASETVYPQMAAAGATAFRLNTSHLSLEQLDRWLDRLAPFLTDSPYPLVLDLQGSKWRLGDFPSFELIPGERVELIHTAATNQPRMLPVPHSDFFRAAACSGDEIVLNDAKSRLAVEQIIGERIAARVLQGGPIVSHKGITFRASSYRQDTLSEKDRAIVAQTQGLGLIHFAISYIKDAAEMQRYRSLIGPRAKLIAKLERASALEDVLPIAEASDGLWLCRGDLGAELGLRAMAEQVHRFADRVLTCPRPIWMAGQVLEHMTEHATPTRSEICFLYDSLVRGYRGFVLSDETAVGRYAVESCRAAAMFKNEHFFT